MKLACAGISWPPKDGAIRHVMSGVSPQGCQVFSFKHPSALELGHDFLWCTTHDLPERGRIGIFNRSCYEEVLVVLVHRAIPHSEAIPDAPHDDAKIWHDRYCSITDMEQHLHANGTEIVKIFLHRSKEKRRQRFLARRRAYEACLSATNTDDSPWFAVPGDDKENAG